MRNAFGHTRCQPITARLWHANHRQGIGHAMACRDCQDLRFLILFFILLLCLGFGFIVLSMSSDRTDLAWAAVNYRLAAHCAKDDSTRANAKSGEKKLRGLMLGSDLALFDQSVSEIEAKLFAQHP